MLLFTYSFLFLSSLVLFGLDCLPLPPILEHPQPIFLLRCERQVSHSYKTKAKLYFCSLYFNLRIFRHKTGIERILQSILRVQSAFHSFFNRYPTAFPYGNGMVLHFYQQQESSTTKTEHKVINKGLKAYV